MAVQTVVIDISQTNVKIKSFDKHIDRLGKSFEKLQRQMDRLNQDKRSTGLSLSQGDTLSKSMEKMTDTMTKLFSNGIKINNPTVNAKVTVDFAKMDIAGQVGNAIKSADIAGTILRNIRLPKTGISSASALKMEMPTKMQVEVTNKEIQVKLPKDISKSLEGLGGEKDGKKGLLTNIREGYEKNKSTFSKRKLVKGEFQKNLEKKSENVEKNWDFITKGIPNGFKDLKILPKVFGGVKKNISNIWTGFKGFSLGGKLAMGAGGVATAGFTIFSVALKGLTGVVKGAAGIIKGVVGIFQNIISVASSIWGQVQKWAINPLVGAQNQMSQNKGYWKLLGGQEGAEILDNKIVDMAVKGPYAYESVEGAVRKLVNTGMSQDKALEVTWNYSNMAAAKSLDEEGMMQGIDSYIQVNSGEYVTVDDFNSAANVADPATLAKHLLGVEKAGEKEIEQAKELISTQSISKEKFIDAIGKMGKEYIGLSKEFGGGYESIAEEVASTTYSGITAKIKNIFQGDIVRKWGTGLSDGLAEGLGKFASWLDENRVKFAAWGEQLKSIGREIGQYITNFLQNTGERIKSVFNSTEFQQADLSDKIVIFWDKVIKEPFSNWWESVGRNFFHTAFENLGNTTGGILSGIINGFLGSNLEDGVGEGYNLGFKFAQGFAKGFDGAGIMKKILASLLKISWDYSLGIVVNPIIRGVKSLENGGKEQKVLPDSQYNDLKNGLVKPKLEKRTYDSYDYQVLGDGYATNQVVQQSLGDGFSTYVYTKEDTQRAQKWASEYSDFNTIKRGIESAQEIEYGRAQIGQYKNENQMIDALYKQANDATWEYNHNEMLKKEAEQTGDKDAAFIAQAKMEEAQYQLNAATQQMHDLYPGIIDQENLALNIIEERLNKQKAINEEMKKSRMIELENTLSVKEGQVDSEKELAMNYKNKMDEAYAEVQNFNNNAEGMVDHFQIWGKSNQGIKNMEDKQDKGNLSDDQKKKLEKEIAAAKEERDAAEQAMRERFTNMEFTDDEINKAFKQEEENGYTGATIDAMLKEKSDKLHEDLEEAKTFYDASMAVLQEILIAKDELAVHKIQELTGLSPEELMDPKKWGDLGGEKQKQVLGIIGAVDTLADKFEGLDMDPIHKEIFLDIIQTYGTTGEGGQPTTPIAGTGEGGQTGQPTDGENTQPTEANGGEKNSENPPRGGGPNPPVDFRNTKYFANGDILTSPHIGLVAEAGPEAIIPLSKGRRARGLELWEQAGAMMGVYPHADGGMFGSFAAPKQVSPLYQQMEESKESSEQAENEMGAPARVDIGGINVSLGGFTFNGTEANSREGIMSVIKEQMPDIADEIAGTIAVNIQRIFANMKLQTA